MGTLVIQCYLGFPTHDPSNLARNLEQTAGRVSRVFHEARHQLHQSLETLHEATDHAVDGDERRAGRDLAACLNGLDGVGDALASMHSHLVDIRRALETAPADADDPLLRRDRQLPRLERGAVARRLALRGLDAASDPVYHQVMDALLAGGSLAATRLVERQLLRMQTELRAFVAKTRSIPLHPLREFATQNHERALDALALCLPWARFETLCAYMNFVCERATELELSAEGTEEASRQDIA